MEYPLLIGRRLLKDELPLLYQDALDQFKKIPAMTLSPDTVRCNRCGRVHLRAEVWINPQHIHDEQSFYYCPACLQLGRVDSRAFLYFLEHQREPAVRMPVLTWQGQLTEGQKKISQTLMASVEAKKDLLVWAVTGAGKTEMLFAAIEMALKAGQRVCLASPRVDVCLELYPRFVAAFGQTEISLLYGEQKEAYRYTPLVIVTTHQLLRFYQAFDVLIVDEVDAFPFVNNAMLAYGVEMARKPASCLLYLTATPTVELLKKVQQGQLRAEKLPVRYHGHPLVVPKFVFLWDWQRLLNSGQIPAKLLRFVRVQLQKKSPTLLFCPNIKQMEKLTILLQAKFKDFRIECVDASDPQRGEKVQMFRQEALDLLLTTTILERGVTFPGVDVFVLEANHRVYNASALVQIAGRAGRNVNCPTGLVYFFHSGQSQAMQQAKKQIVTMNRLAKKAGLLKDGM